MLYSVYCVVYEICTCLYSVYCVVHEICTCYTVCTVLYMRSVHAIQCVLCCT